MTIDEYIDILFDGTKGEICALENEAPLGSRYEYSKEFSSMRVYFGNEIAAMHGVPETPNCVPVFGASHVFGAVA